MSNRPDDFEEDDIPETDFSGGVRGKYYERAMQGTNVVLLEPDVAKVFRDSAVVSQALREYLSEHGAPHEQGNVRSESGIGSDSPRVHRPGERGETIPAEDLIRELCSRE